MRVGHPGPEFADAARDQIGVSIELGQFLKRNDLPRTFVGEGAKIELHPFRERRDNLAHGLAIRLAQLRQDRQRGAE